MAAPAPRVDNFKAFLSAAKGVAPWVVLFYGIDYFQYGDAGSAALTSAMLYSTLFLVAFLAIGFFRARARLKQLAAAPMPQVIVVQQPVYMPPPGYGYAPQAGQPGVAPPYGHPPYGQPAVGQAPYGQAPYGRAPYGQPPLSAPGQPYFGPAPQPQPALPSPQQPVMASWPPPQAPAPAPAQPRPTQAPMPPPPPAAPSADDDPWVPASDPQQDPRRRAPPK